jgi:AcrR family transcriptional regulator
MGSQERRAREKALVHDRILDAARALFTRHGYEAVTMRRIAQKVEYTPTALYFHFRNKEALLQALSDQAALSLGLEFGKLRKVQDPLERVRRMGKAYIQFGLAHPNEYRLLFMTQQPGLPPEHSAIRKGDPDQDAYALLVQTMAEAKAAGLLRPALTDPEQAAQVLWSGMHGFVSLILVRHNDPWIDWRPVASSSRLVIDTLMAGLTRPMVPANTISSRKGARSFPADKNLAVTTTQES